MSASHNFQLLRMASLLKLERRSWTAAADELKFVILNETAQVVPYRQAALWDQNRKQLLGMSGVSEHDDRSPLSIWLSKLFKTSPGRPFEGTGLRLVERDSVPDWPDDWPPYAVWAPFPGPKPTVLILFTRAEPWGESDLVALDHLICAYGAAWSAASHAGGWRPKGGFERRLSILAALLIVGAVVTLVPIRSSVLAPAEIAPGKLWHVRAPFEGVIEQVLVAPNQTVKVGQPLLIFDRSLLSTRLKVAEKERDVTLIEHAQAGSMSLQDPRAKAKMPLLRGRLDQQSAEVEYLRELLARAELTAETDGVVLFSSTEGLIGRPVAQGEGIMKLADPSSVVLEIALAVDDAVPMSEGDAVEFFLNTAPLAPLSARLDRISHLSEPRADGALAFKLRAALQDGETPPRIGVKGTAKIYGETTTPLMLAARRPLAKLLQWFSW
ncbi:MAG TPA: hypothetical protein DIW20_00565 [Rhodospirillaceae bacterium]|nr:hypothetical protein [Rhodospirillaceae bacterium]